MALTKSLRFCANLNFLFGETANVLEKLRLAKQAGFLGVEIGFPAQFSDEQVVAAKNDHNLQVILINICLGKYNLAVVFKQK